MPGYQVHPTPHIACTRHNGSVTRRLRLLPLLLLAALSGVLFAGCLYGGIDTAVRGTITFAEEGDFDLPDDYTLTVRLVDVTRREAGEEAFLVGERIFEDTGNLPFDYYVFYEEKRVHQGNTYVVEVKIELDSELLYITEAIFPVLTHGYTDQRDVQVVSVKE